MSDLTKHTLTINISNRIEWIDKRCGLTEIQKDYITAQMKEAVSEALQQANDISDNHEKALPINIVIERAFNAGREKLSHPDWDYIYEDHEEYMKKHGL